MGRVGTTHYPLPGFFGFFGGLFNEKTHPGFFTKCFSLLYFCCMATVVGKNKRLTFLG